MPEKIKVSSVVRHLDTGLRDLRCSEPAVPKPTDKAAISANLSAGELGEWRAEFMASISELDAIAKEGSDCAKSQLERAVNDYRAATAKAEEAERAAKDTAKVAKEASKPALLNVTIEGEFDDTVSVSVDNAEMITTTKRSFAIERLIPGNAKVDAAALIKATTVAGFPSHLQPDAITPAANK